MRIELDIICRDRFCGGYAFSDDLRPARGDLRQQGFQTTVVWEETRVATSAADVIVRCALVAEEGHSARRVGRGGRRYTERAPLFFHGVCTVCSSSPRNYLLAIAVHPQQNLAPKARHTFNFPFSRRFTLESNGCDGAPLILPLGLYACFKTPSA